MFRTNLDIAKVSSQYAIRKLNRQDADAVFALCSKNELYYQHCPPFVTKGSVIADMEALPPGRSERDKFFLGFFEGASLVAILDLIIGYPNESTAYIGLFMTDIRIQGKGAGTSIIEELCTYLAKIGMQRVELAWVKGNPQSERFWIKNKFVPIGEGSSDVAAQVIRAERRL